MRLSRWTIVLGAATFVAAGWQAVRAADAVVIGDIDDMSGVYADVEGAGGVEAINMAIADFAASELQAKMALLHEFLGV